MKHAGLSILSAPVLAAVLAACQAPPPAAPAAPPPAPVAEPEPPPAAPIAAPVPSGPVGAAAQAQAHKLAMAAVELLEAGKEEAAVAELQRALAIDPQSKLALNLTRQIETDPQTTYGRDSFPYTVRPSDTLSRIAQRFLGDIYAFYALARYNNIAVPRQVSAGQVLRIPGKPPAGGTAAPPAPPRAPAPPPPAPVAEPRVATVPPAAAPAPAAAPPPPPPPPPAPEPTPGERALRSAAAAERAGDLARARAEYQNAAALDQPGAAAKAEQMGKQLAQRHAGAAKAAFTRQDLDASIANWQRVLDIDPDHPQARSEIVRMRALKDKLGQVK